MSRQEAASLPQPVARVVALHAEYAVRELIAAVLAKRSQRLVGSDRPAAATVGHEQGTIGEGPTRR